MFSGDSKLAIVMKSFRGSNKLFLSFSQFLFLFFLFSLSFKILYISCLFTLIAKSITIDFFFLFALQHFLAIKLLLRCGDIESNPGPKSKNGLSICHYNLNSLAAHNFSKLSSLEAFNAVHNFDILCLSETYLDTSFSLNDPALALKGYQLVRADHPLNV